MVHCAHRAGRTVIVGIIVPASVAALTAWLAFRGLGLASHSRIALRLADNARRRSGRADQGLGRDVPLLADLIALGLGAGLTPQHALDLAVRWGPHAAVAPIERIGVRVELGATFAQSLGELAHDAPPYAPLATALLAAYHGAPVQGLISRLASEARAELRRRGERRARRVPVLLLFPLIFLVLPAFVICTVAPLVLVHFSDFTN